MCQLDELAATRAGTDSGLVYRHARDRIRPAIARPAPLCTNADEEHAWLGAPTRTVSVSAADVHLRAIARRIHSRAVAAKGLNRVQVCVEGRPELGPGP